MKHNVCASAIIKLEFTVLVYSISAMSPERLRYISDNPVRCLSFFVYWASDWKQALLPCVRACRPIKIENVKTQYVKHVRLVHGCGGKIVTQNDVSAQRCTQTWTKTEKGQKWWLLLAPHWTTVWGYEFWSHSPTSDVMTGVLHLCQMPWCYGKHLLSYTGECASLSKTEI